MTWQKIYFIGFTAAGLAAGAYTVNKPRPVLTPKVFAAAAALSLIHVAVVLSI